jgi:hypothetical protein
MWKLLLRGNKRQGTTSVVPKMRQKNPGLQPLREVLRATSRESGFFPPNT